MTAAPAGVVALDDPRPPASAPRRRRVKPARSGVLDIVAMVLATGLAGGWALYELGAKSLWVDEATTWGTASQHGATLWYWLLHDGGNMLGYYALMHLVVGVAGSGATVLRLPTALSFIALAPCAYLLVRRLFDRRAAIFSAFLVPCSASLVFWAQEARGYLPGVLAVTAGALALVTALEEDRRRWPWFAFVACSVVAAYMVLLTSLVVVAQVLALALLPRGRVAWRRAAAASAAIVVLWSPLAAAALHRGSGQLDWIPRPNFAGYQYLGRFLASGPASNLVTWTTGAAGVAGVAVFVVRLARNGRSSEAFAAGLLVAWVVVPIGLLFLVSVEQPVMVDRYLLPMVPAVSMLAGVACSRLRPAPLAWAAGIALVVVRAWVVPPDYAGSIEYWSTATTFVADHMQPHDCIGFFVADGFTAFDYYELRLPRGADALPQPVLPAGATWGSKLPYVLDPAAFPAGELPKVEADCPRLWLVETHQAGEPPGPGVPSYQVAKYEATHTLDVQLAGGYRHGPAYSFVGVYVALYLERGASSS